MCLRMLVLFTCMATALGGAAHNVSDDIWTATSDPDSDIITEDWLALGFGRVGKISFEEPTEFLEAMRQVLTPEQFTSFERFARALGEFGATLMVAGSLPGKTQTLSIAVYEAVQAGEDALANQLVLLISMVCILILLAVGRLARARDGR